MSCKQTSVLSEAFLDGELPADQTLSLEEHVAECEACQERVRFGAALRTSVRHAVRADAVPSAGFEGRLSSALRAERERVLEIEPSERAGVPFGRRRFGALVPLLLSAAATFALVTWFNSRLDHERAEGVRAPEPPHALASLLSQETPEQVLDELVNYHAAPPAPQFTEPGLVQGLEPEVGVPIRVPALKAYGASWEGGGVVPMKNQRAAIFRYRLSNHPVTVYVYDARRVPLRGVLEPLVVHNQAVSVGERRGYSIAAREQRGVGYAVATDLNDEESAELVSTIY